jgi:hypothetical protein
MENADTTQQTGRATTEPAPAEPPPVSEKRPKTAGQVAYEAYAGHFRDDVKEAEWWSQSHQSRNAWEAAAGAAIQMAASKGAL